VRVAAVVRDLILYSRIEAAASAAGANLARMETPQELPPPAEVDVAIVDWAERDPSWGPMLASWRASAPKDLRLIVFGRHTDLEAHRSARDAGLGPMWARSKLVAALAELFAGGERVRG
jgi:hypothetical protein